MSNLLLDICADDYTPGQVFGLNDKYGNYKPYIYNNGQLFVNEQGFYSQDNGGWTGIAVEDSLKLPQFYEAPNLALIAVVRMPKKSIPLARNRNGEFQFIWHSNSTNTNLSSFAPLNLTISTDNGKMKLENLLLTGEKILPYINDEIYIFASFTQREKGIIIKRKTEVYTRFGFYTQITNKLDNQVNGLTASLLNTTSLNYPFRLLFGCCATLSNNIFMGNIKRCGIYPYSKIQEFKKLYLGK